MQATTRLVDAIERGARSCYNDPGSREAMRSAAEYFEGFARAADRGGYLGNDVDAELFREISLKLLERCDKSLARAQRSRVRNAAKLREARSA